MNKLLIPNTCQVPNVLLDEVMRYISDPALRVLLAIVRKTYGFQKQADNISLTQLQEITALSRQGVVNGIKALGSLVTVRRGKREGNEYALNLNVETGELVNGVDQSTRLTSQRSGKNTSQRGRHTKPNKNKTHKSKREGEKISPYSLSTKENRKLTRPASGIPPELQPTVSRIVARINELSGSKFKDDRPDALEHLIARLKVGATETECMAVVEHQWRRWGTNEEMVDYFNPTTLFRKKNFPTYLANAQRAGADGKDQAKPTEVKDIGNGMIEVDGRQMDRKTYERRYGQTTA